VPDPQLTAVSRTQGNNRALKEGLVAPKRYRLAFQEVPVLVNAFRRMVRGLEFDVCEMAITTYLCAKSFGKPLTALPVFLVRGFHHGAIVISDEGAISRPKDLEGRRVGVSRGYTVTTGVWARAVLQDEYGVDLDTITWVLSGDEHVAEYQAPPNVVPMPRGANLADLVTTGELAAAIGVPADRPGLVRLIPDARAAGYAALRERGHYPINHLVVVRDELLKAHPDLATDVFQAFAESKDLYLQGLRSGQIGDADATDVMHRRVMEITGQDPLPYGIAPNLTVIEELIDHAVRQQILRERPAVEELFAPATRDLVG
jgi:4,5-dihydroxyphthalate decarboxylase